MPSMCGTYFSLYLTNENTGFFDIVKVFKSRINQGREGRGGGGDFFLISKEGKMMEEK